MHRPKRLILVNLISHTESIFEFRQGKAILIGGKNNDKQGQKSNGSGKSGVGEGIALAVAATTIREALVRELITRGEPSCEITLIFENLRTGKDFTIWRKFYASSTKSSECRLWQGERIDENEIKNCADVNTYNKRIFDILGISRDDFFNFYLVTKERYSPFLSASQTKKVEIVNRFSGADSVDNTKEFIDIDSIEKGSEISKIDKDLQALGGRLVLLKEQKLEEEGKITQEIIDQQKEEIDQSILTSEGIIFQKKIDLNRVCKILRSAVVERKTFKEPEYIQKGLDHIQKWNQVWDTISNRLSTKRKDLSSFEQKVADVEEVEKETKKELEAFKEKKTEVSNKITALELEQTNTNNQIQGAITCPKCSHEFSLRYKDFDITVAKARVKEIEEIELPKLDIEIKAVEKTILSYKEIFEEIDEMKVGINDEIKVYRAQIDIKLAKVTIKIESLTTLKNDLENKRREYKQTLVTFKTKVTDAFSDYKRYLGSLKTETKVLETLKENLVKLDEIDDSKIGELSTQIEELEVQELKLKEDLQVKTDEKNLIDQWLVSFKGFKSFLANQSIKNISDYTNLFLNGMNSDITIDIEGYKLLSSGKLKEEISTMVLRDGFPVGSYGTFSAGERGRIEIAVILANRELVNLNSPTGGLDLLLADEILDSVDSMGLEYLIDSLQPLQQTILVISQNEINALLSSTVIIEKTNGVSVIPSL